MKPFEVAVAALQKVIEAFFFLIGLGFKLEGDGQTTPPSSIFLALYYTS